MKKIFIATSIAATLLATSVIHAQREVTAKPVVPRTVAVRGPLLEHERSLVALFENAAPSVAYITTENLVQRGFFGTGVAQGAGSGFVWDTQGHVVTNFHVIALADEVKVAVAVEDRGAEQRGGAAEPRLGEADVVVLDVRAALQVQ